MHFVNSQSEYKISQEEVLIEEIIQQTTNLIEQDLHIVIDRDEFNYNRFLHAHVLLLEADAQR